ncbi:hypothetical protein [Pyrococcus abyssi]|uniref:Uncharacterized protein n=1 Tax=Pyrococcus abyssi (strain GE5 / Orsay) TaxID=272844 RepID=Q9V2A3_PYRAB|nr:hypothetical protein [Pyrococcus abyssi]CAB49095.1 Hypothetical protein PAB0114 [Pyrococcus abyssi GE5]CCE69547.1 TPA: hypothetical protein PAB0114 [Pyrococcus abyssi GE5]
MRQDVLYLSLSLVFLLLSNLLSSVEPKDILDASEGDLVEFSGVCGYSSGDFSILTDGKMSIPVYAPLKVGKVYKVIGVYRNGGIKPREITNGSVELETIVGAYWFDYAPSILTPRRVYLKYPINASPGDIVEVKGAFFGSKLVPVSYKKLGHIEEPKDGYPLEIEGRVVKGGNPSYVKWRGRTIKVYLKDNASLETGSFVNVLGIVRVYGNKITMYAYNVTVIEHEGAD